MGKSFYERTHHFGKYKINAIVIFHDGEETSIRLYLALDDYGYYCKAVEFKVAQKLSPAIKEMLVDQLVQTYGLLLLPNMIQWKEKINIIDTPEVKEVVKLKTLEEYTEDVAMSIIKAAIPYLKV